MIILTQSPALICCLTHELQVVYWSHTRTSNLFLRRLVDGLGLLPASERLPDWLRRSADRDSCRIRRVPGQHRAHPSSVSMQGPPCARKSHCLPGHEPMPCSRNPYVLHVGCAETGTVSFRCQETPLKETRVFEACETAKKQGSLLRTRIF